MTDQQQRTTWALQLLESFVGNWAAVGAFPHLQDDYEKLRRTIQAIAPTEAKPLGFAIYGLKPETPERRRESGFETVVISAVFDKPPDRKFLEERKRKPHHTPAYADFARFIDYGICSVQQIPG